MRTPRPGSPPQVRGKLSGFFQNCPEVRITPAGAGKTFENAFIIGFLQDHPRRCGENLLLPSRSCTEQGSPPQVRGKPQRQIEQRNAQRITPAGAGKTRVAISCANSARDHPRRCGENASFLISHFSCIGSPPQVRGKLYATEGVPLKYRITPAGAGKTLILSTQGEVHTDHPRRCGENVGGGYAPARLHGSPPQVRGKH